MVSGLVAGCGSTGPGSASECGRPAQARVAGNVMYVGSCTGLLGIPAEKVTLHAGEKIDLRAC
jgi:hypothetical protein